MYLSFSIKLMEFPYSLDWNNNWNFVFITKINRTISKFKMEKTKK